MLPKRVSQYVGSYGHPAIKPYEDLEHKLKIYLVNCGNR